MVGSLLRECAVRDRPDHEHARSAELGLGEAVLGAAVGRPRGDGVVPPADRAPYVHRPDRDHERVVAGRVEDAARTLGRAVVARGSDDDDPVEPELLDRPVERVEEEVRGDRRVEREVCDLDVVGVLVRQDPLRGGDHVGRPRDPVVVHHADREDVGGRRGPGVVGPAVGGDPGNERAVPVAVALGARRQRAEVDLRVVTAVEVRVVRVEARVDDRDRGRIGRRLRVAAPERRDAGDVRPELGVELDVPRGLNRGVRRDHEARDPREPRDPLGLELDRDAVDQREPLGDLATVSAAVPREGRSRGVRAAGGLDDHPQPLAAVRLRLLEEAR